jgi:hypothetical protein
MGEAVAKSRYRFLPEETKENHEIPVRITGASPEI